MKAFHKTKDSITDDEEAKTALDTWKEGSEVKIQQYLQVDYELTSVSRDLKTTFGDYTMKFKAEPATEEDFASSFGAAVGALAVVISVMAF